MEDDVGIWVTFDVPPGHYLHEKFVPVDREALPAHIPVQRVIGRVLGGNVKPDINQLRDAMREAYRDACATDKTGPDHATAKAKSAPAAQPTTRTKSTLAAQSQSQEDSKEAQLASLRKSWRR